eukprot:440313-Alexandrium_andersonii.AAC.1
MVLQVAKALPLYPWSGDPRIGGQSRERPNCIAARPPCLSRRRRVRGQAGIATAGGQRAAE